MKISAVTPHETDSNQIYYASFHQYLNSPYATYVEIYAITSTGTKKWATTFG